MKFETLYVSPKMAEEWLATTSTNRAVVPSRVLQFENSMRAGKWELNGEPIIISDTGRLLDGQHRLHAVLKFGQPVQLCIVRGVKDKAFDTIDTGRPRSQSDILGMEGIQQPGLCAAAAGMIWRMYHSLGIWEACDAWATRQIIRRYPSITKYAQTVNNVHRKCPLPGASLLTAMVYFEDVANKPSTALRFFEKMVNGTELEEGSPYLTLRNRLIAMKQAGLIMNARSCWMPVTRTITALENGDVLNIIRVEKSQGAIIRRPERWLEHVEKMPKERRLDDLRPRDRAGGNTSATIQERVQDLRSRAPDAKIKKGKPAEVAV